MKKIIKAIAEIALCALLGVIATAVVLAIFALFLAMPDILNWVSSYIGTAMTWVLFIFLIGAVITYCIAE